MSVWMAGLPDAFQALWLPAVLLSGVVTGVLLAGGPRRRGLRTVEQAAPSHETRRPAFAAGEIDLGGELRGIAEGQGAAAAARRIRLQVALEPNLIVRADPLAVHAIVGDLLRNAIGHSEGGHVLLGAARHGGRVRITVGDDGTPVDRAEQVADLRDAERLVALQGGTFEISVQPKSGTLVTVRLPEKPAISTGEKNSSGAIEQIAAERLVALQGGTFEISVQPKSGTLVTVRLPDKPAISTVEKTSSGAIEQIAAERRAPAAARVE